MYQTYGAEDKHKVFISYYHADDEVYRDQFEQLFSHLFINQSVDDGDIDEDNSDEYIKRLIQEGYISGASVVLVLCGPNTWRRKHVDWEISASLNKKVGGYSGLMGLHLPSHPDFQTNKYNRGNIPARLADNLESGFAMIYDWTIKEAEIKNRIQKAFDSRENSELIQNSRPQITDNL